MLADPNFTAKGGLAFESAVKRAMTNFDSRDANFDNNPDKAYFAALVAKNPQLASSVNLLISAVQMDLVKIEIDGKNLSLTSTPIDIHKTKPDSMSLGEWKNFLSEVKNAITKVFAALGAPEIDWEPIKLQRSLP